MNERDINKKAAEICGLKIFTFDDDHFEVSRSGLADPVAMCIFNIFTRQADREATVIALGLNHGVFLRPRYDDDSTDYPACYNGWIVDDGRTAERDNLLEADLYNEALSLAVEAL